jgi:hypothetical protein
MAHPVIDDSKTWTYLLEPQQMGWPEPPRSACWMCPNHTNSSWKEMKVNCPEDFQKAVDFERAMRVKRPELFLHKTLQPLEAVDFTDDQMDMYGESCLGGCFT